MRILFLGDIVGERTVRYLQRTLAAIRTEEGIDFCLANAENAADGLGITKAIAAKLYDAGLDCLTLGNHAFARRDTASWIGADTRMVRPLNGGLHWPGEGVRAFETPFGTLLVVALLGEVFLQCEQAPFSAVARLLADAQATRDPRFILVDFHAEATSEKTAMAHFLDGKVSALLGTHTHVPTADARVLPRGTGYQTDVGMCGPQDGVIGMHPEAALRRFVDRMPARYRVSAGPTVLQGVCLDLDPQTGRCLSIVRRTWREEPC